VPRLWKSRGKASKPLLWKRALMQEKNREHQQQLTKVMKASDANQEYGNNIWTLLRDNNLGQHRKHDLADEQHLTQP
jgi:hypothetical protein